MDDFPPNSNKSREPKPTSIPASTEKKVKKVVEGEVQRRKTPLGKRFSSIFFGGDAKSVMSYVVMDVLIPSAKDMFSDMVSQGIEKLLFGEARSTTRRGAARTGGSGGYVSYNRYSSNTPTIRREEQRTEISRRARSTHDFDEIILATRAEAEEVIGRLFDLIAKYENASVGDLYELVGITPQFTDDKWGWTDLRGASVTHIRGGYLLNLPPTEPLD